jgi:hypothetical protein
LVWGNSTLKILITTKKVKKKVVKKKVVKKK